MRDGIRETGMCRQSCGLQSVCIELFVQVSDSSDFKDPVYNCPLLVCFFKVAF